MEAWHDPRTEKKATRHSRSRDRLGSYPKIRHSNERIKSDVYYTLGPIYHLSKICGLLPVKFTQDKSGKYAGHLDWPQVAYGVLLVLIFIAAQCWGLYRDLRNGWQNSTRLSSSTSITVTFGDVFAVMTVVFIAILGSARRWRHLQAALDNVVEVDEKLGIVTSKNLRKFSIIVMFITLAYLLMVSTVDGISWTLSSRNKNIQNSGDSGPLDYCPLCFMYVVVITFMMQYAIVLFNIGERFLKLNKAIENLMRTNSIIGHMRKDMGLAVPDPRKELLSQSVSFVSTDMEHSRHRRSNKLVADFAVSGEGASEAIDQLITLHGILCDSIIHINKAYGGGLLMGTISTLTHLIITPYFLYNEIFSDNSSSLYMLWIQVLWIIFHVYKMLLFVQPCYMVATKARTTGALVSQALNSKWDPEARKMLEIFSMQLLQRPVELTACGLFFLDRRLLTSLLGSVTTYLVILVQFQDADDAKGTKHLLQDATDLLKNASTIKNASALKTL